MTPPRFPSASPLPSFAANPGYLPTRPTPSLAESLKAIIAWWRGTRPSFREQVREAKLVERLAAELEEEDRGR